jgi:hypothetical protein
MSGYLARDMFNYPDFSMYDNGLVDPEPKKRIRLNEC